MEIVRRYSDRVLAFYDGAIIADGNAAGVLANSQVLEFITGETPVAASNEIGAANA
jgi:branched-chain amino acid transport system ATP-binding protein